METQIILEPAGKTVRIDIGKDRAPETALTGGMLSPGEEIGDFRVDGLLSLSGGEAEAYLCTKGGETFVLKYYYAKKPDSEVEEKIKSISHQNIISILDYGEYKDRFYIISEYAAGGALDDKLPDSTYKYLPLSEDEVRQIVREAISAFEACHKAGIIHRDIKPGNLLYKNHETRADGRHKGSHLMIGDFGIASVFEVDAGMSKHMTETGARTEGYAAPEAYSGVIGKEYDYYSLGVTLWVLLTGMEPFVDEKGQALYSGHITLDTIHGKTVDKLLSRSPKISAFMQKLIRGLLTVRHDKRWKFDEVTRHLAGEDVELFNEVRTLPLVEIGGEKCSSYREIAHAIISHPEEGKIFVFGKKEEGKKNVSVKLTDYLYSIKEQKYADKLSDIIDNYSAEKREDEGAVYIAYSLCPNMAFPLEHGLSISSLGEMLTVLDTDPDAILPFLRDEKRGFYAYLEVSGLGEHGRKVKEIVNASAGDIRAVSRIIAAFQDNVIKPFQDGKYHNYPLASLKDLYNLPSYYLKERAMIFIERNYGLLPAWLENVTGKDLDLWLALLPKQKERIASLGGTWEYFILFMHGLADYDKVQKNGVSFQGDFFLYEKNGKKVLFYFPINADQAQLLYEVETGGNRLALKKNGAAVFNGTYAVNLAAGYDDAGISKVPFIDAEGRMAVFDGARLSYFGINSGLKEQRYELKDGEIDLLFKLGNAIPSPDIGRSFKERNNFTDMNRLIDAFLKKHKDEKRYGTERELMILIDSENMEGLPHSFDYYQNEIGNSYFMENSYREALPYFEKALQINPSGIGSDSQSYNYGYGRALYSMGGQENLNKAIGYMDRAISITPKKSQPLAIKGFSLYKLGDHNKAMASLSLALDNKTLTNPEKGTVFATRAMCYDALGMKDKADKDRTEADRYAK
jgi:serine/threonine protein kinase/tetratricopeptide (TPR) repeat protein